MRKNTCYMTILSLSLCISMLLSGCSASAKNGGSKHVNLNTVSMLGEGDSASEPYQKLIADFMTKYPEITINDQSEVSTEAWKTKILEQFSVDETTPDVIFYFTGADAKQLILNDEFVSVEEIRTVYPDYATNIRPSAMNFVEEFDSNHYSVPVRGFWEGLFCNKDLFDQYSLPLPNNWESFTHAIDVFAENGIIPIAASFAEVPHYWIEHSILSQAGSVEHRLNPSGYVPPSWVQGLESLKSLYDRKAFPLDNPTLSNAEAMELFVNKKAAMILEGSWVSASITDKENTVVLPVPKTSNGKKEPTDIISGFSSGYYITRKAWEDKDKREAAVNFVLHMTSNESITYLCEFGGAPAVDIPESANNSTLKNYETTLQSESKNAIMPIDSRLNKEAWQYLCQQIPEIMQERITPIEVVLKMSELNKW